ncbi:hypothetical protein [Xanthomonas tesorieronis]|uniref:hypothetical protein n=1 Tax=Xanthomonas tesorieronis TaxID=3160839 RepID=UPI00351672C2
MGYHLITRREDGTISNHFSETLEGLCKFDGIAADSIIYQAAEEWTPSVVGDDDTYKLLAEDWFRAGIRAQWQFFEEAKHQKLIPEKIHQDRESFQAYTSATTSPIKRGDYLLRTKGIEIEVKCLTLYGGYYYLPYSAMKSHQAMQELSSTPVWFAIYERQADTPVHGSLHMVSVAAIFEQNNKLVQYDKRSKCLRVPQSMTNQGFSGL